MAEERERQFKYRWTRTWDDTPEHYTAWDGERSIGIVHRFNSISAGGWYWACNAHLEWLGSNAGTTETKAEACREVRPPMTRWWRGSRRPRRGAGNRAGRSDGGEPP